MYNQTTHDNATSNVLSWTTHCSNMELLSEEEAADADEPPPPLSAFKRGPIRRGSEHHESLLTKALHSQSEEETTADTHLFTARRRRSITSTASLASTAELTCSTGITTPARTSSPSPRIPDIGFVPLAPKTPSAHVAIVTPVKDLTTQRQTTTAQDPPVQALQRKRCISFACAAKPATDTKRMVSPAPKPADETPKPAPASQAAPKRSCIKFACPSRPSGKSTPPPTQEALATTPVPGKLVAAQKDTSPSSVQKHRSPSTARSFFRSQPPRRPSQSPVAVRTKKYLTANSNDLQSEDSRFHEFARDEPQEDDWIRREDKTKQKLTINDTLQKENVIRKLGKEAEEEAELEEDIDDDVDEVVDGDEDGEDLDGDDLDNADDDENGDEDEDPELDNFSGYSSDDDASDGYNTDNEVGFASSDDEDNDELDIWNLSRATQLFLPSGTSVQRRSSFGGNHSDSSIYSKRNLASIRTKREGSGHVDIRPHTPELPDSTDFVCGTLDEDRPLEEAYISCIAARKKKQRTIPQDIDPSFPASDPEDEEEDASRQGDSDDQLWLHGELEDIHHEQQDRTGRKKRADNQSPKRYRSPPPKRHISPPPKARGRSPRRLFDYQSPRRFKSPPAHLVKSPLASPAQTAQGIAFKSLAFCPGLPQTKSLPKTPAVFPLLKGRKSRAGTINKQAHHIRGAIDIVKGLEEKRQRRKEKFYQKYCQHRARKERERTQEKRPAPGKGAERMREIGLLMAGKIGQGNYVISV